MRTITIFAALVAASSAASSPAEAQTRGTIAVHYADLDLGTEAGRRALDLRVIHAVNAACGEASPADLRGQNAARACRTALRADAAAQREIALAAHRQGSANILAARR